MPASGAGDGADASWGPFPRSKLRTDAKVKDVYKMGKTLGTGGGAPHLGSLVQMQAPFQHSLAGPAWFAASAAAVCVTDILQHRASKPNAINIRLELCCRRVLRGAQGDWVTLALSLTDIGGPTGFSVVKLVTEKATKCEFACKVLACGPFRHISCARQPSTTTADSICTFVELYLQPSGPHRAVARRLGQRPGNVMQ